MATITHPTETELVKVAQSASPLLGPLLECSTELQAHALKMLKVLLAPDVDDEDRFLAASTLADILFPNTHDGDRMLGLDLQEAERIAVSDQNPDRAAAVAAREALAAMDAEEATFAARLDRVLKAQGVTQTELAQRIGVRQPAISMMLARECRPQKRTVRRIADALSIKPEELWPGLA